MIENIQVKPGVEAARVIINSRTGTVVIGADVKSFLQQQSPPR
ncbi:flagellar basal body P-ring protein FlgI [Hydrogenovibrio kuenenii]|nr:flagellar basal body P-ring protein FlgI [Hydrogenovibrio kuenenii]